MNHPLLLKHLLKIAICLIVTLCTVKSSMSQDGGNGIMASGPGLSFDTTNAPMDAFSKDILQLLTTTKALEASAKAASQVFDNMLSNFPEDKKQVFEEIFSRIINDMQQGDSKRWLMNFYVKLYRKKFTHDEIKQLSDFYKTPLGQKTTSLLPEIQLESSQYGQKVGAYLGQKFYEEVTKEQEGNNK